MKGIKLLLKRSTVIASVLAIVGGILWLGAWRSGVFQTPPNLVPAATLPAAPPGLPVLNNSCSGGTVTFTFDDGPSPANTLPLLAELKAEHVPAIFFVIGEHVAANPAIAKAEVKNGFLIEDHTWDHQSFTGLSTKTKPLTKAQAKAELTKDINEITSLGLPRPVLWRAPYDDTNASYDAIATSLGLKLVMSYGTPPQDNIVDSEDWMAISPQQIANYVENGNVSTATKTMSATPALIAPATAANGYTTSNGGTYVHGFTGGSVLGFHDGTINAPNTTKAIPLIVSYMNAHHLCATTTIPADDIGLPAGGSTGGSG